MDSLLTPAPSFDPPMPGSSPIKQQRHHHHHNHNVTKAGRSASGTMPFTSLDLNLTAQRAKTFQAERQKAGETPPPSSPIGPQRYQSATGKAGLSDGSSPPFASGASPCKSQRTARRSFVGAGSSAEDTSEARLVRGPFYPASRQGESVISPQEEPAPLPLDVGLELNPDAAQAAEAPHLLWACRTHSLVIGRSKLSGMPHASWRQEHQQQQQDGVVMSQDVRLLQSIAPSTQGLGAHKLVRVALPNEARHVSRIHAIIEWVPFVQNRNRAGATFSCNNGDEAAGTYIVRIVGQNGLIVDGKRRREGQVLRLTPAKSTLDFFGVKCRFQARSPKMVAAAAPAVDQQHQQTADASGSRMPTVAAGLSPVKRLSFAQLQDNRDDAAPHVRVGALPSSPPPTSELHFPSSSPPSESSIGGERPTKGRSQPSSSGPELLKAGVYSQRRIMVGASDDEEDDEEDDDEDDDYVPDPVVLTTSMQMDASLDAAGSDLSPTPSPSRAAAPALVSRSRSAEASTSTSRAPPSKKPTATKLDPSQPPSSTSKPAQAERLTESQTRMPPPVTAAIRAGARRSASNSPAPTSPLVGMGSSSGSSFTSGCVQDWQGLTRRCVRQLAPTYDLTGLLAGAIVFHRTATISASEAVRSVLASTPGLMKGEAGEQSVAFSPSRRKLPGSSSPLKHGCTVEGWPVASEGGEKWASIARKAWREHLEVVLQSSPMFGVIHRAGKDASGNPLECWYYYDKENDPDRERAENLGAFAKPMRKAIKGQKPIFWKKSGYGSREDFETPAAPPPAAELGMREEEESINIATSSSSSSSCASTDDGMSQRPSTGAGMKRRFAGGDEEDEEARRERLRAKIARSGVWDETQPEEKDEASWDREGDMDWKKSRSKCK